MILANLYRTAQNVDLFKSIWSGCRKKVSFEKIYDYWKEFAQHCEPEENWQEWYDSFADVIGIERKDISSFKDDLLSNGAILQAVKNNTNYTVTLKFFSDIMVIGKPTREEKNH